MVMFQPRLIQTRLATVPYLALAVVGMTLLAAAPAPAWGLQAGSPTAPNEADAADAVVVYLVRHAERAEDGSDDPPLALAGQIRAQTLRQLLAEAGVTQVHTTDWKRTRDTARPIADELGLEPSFYDARDLQGFAQFLKVTPAHHLVVGHSNTTPMLVEALGGDPSDPIDDLEYDRLYIVVIPPGQAPLTTILRFGEPYVEGVDFGLRADSARRTGGPASSNRRQH